MIDYINTDSLLCFVTLILRFPEFLGNHLLSLKKSEFRIRNGITNDFVEEKKETVDRK